MACRRLASSWFFAIAAITCLASADLDAVAVASVNSTGPLPIPDPPNVSQRQAELYSYRHDACNDSVPVVSDAKFVFSAVARGEAPYVEEWVLYHLFIGVDLIYLYDNEVEPTYHRMFKCNPRVHVIHLLSGKEERMGIQMLAQVHFMTNWKHKHTWAMLPNVDEFLVMKHYVDVKDLVREHISVETPGIDVQWLMIGHNNQVLSTFF